MATHNIMHEVDSIPICQAQNQLGESFRNLCTIVSSYNVKQLEKRKAHFINALEAADVDTCMSLAFIERCRENAMKMYPTKNVEVELQRAIPISSSTRGQQGAVRSKSASCKSSSRSPTRQRSHTTSPTLGTDLSVTYPPTPSPERPSWSGSISLTSSTKERVITMNDLKVNLVLSGLSRRLEFSQWVADVPGIHSSHAETFTPPKRNVTISIIRDNLVDSMVSWASQCLDGVAAMSFGVSYAKLKTKSYWQAVSKRGTSFVVSVADDIVGYIPCLNINSLDINGVPAYFGATQRQSLAVKNLVCLGYLKGTGRNGVDAKGVMLFALRNVIHWIFSAEQRVTGCMVVVKIPHSDVDSSKPEVIENILKARRLAESLDMKVQPDFRGSRMGSNNAYVLLRQDCK